VLDKSESAPGEVTFNVKNDGAVPHEFVAVKSDEAPDKLPLDSATGTADESTLKIAGKINEFAAKATATDSFTLEPGKYMVLCNLPGHFQAGMHTQFTVQ